MYSKSIAPHYNNSAMSCHSATGLAIDATRYAFHEMMVGHHVTRTSDSLSILPEKVSFT